jgi:hypothetical protein
MVADGRKNVENFTLVLCGVTNAICREYGQTQAFGDAQRRLIASLFGTVAVALQLNIHIAAAKDFDELFYTLSPCGLAAAMECSGERALFSTRKTEQSVTKLRQVRHTRCPFALMRLTHFEARNELRKVLVTGARRAKQRQPCWLRRMLVRQPERRLETLSKIADSNFRAYVSTDTFSLGRGMKPRRSIKSITVEQRHRRHLRFNGRANQVFRLRGPFEKTEGAGRVQFDILRLSHTALPTANDDVEDRA